MLRKLTPLKAIRQKCLDCCCGSKTEVKLCPIKDCTLYEYRFGKNPKETPLYDDGIALSEETIRKRREQGKRLWESKQNKANIVNQDNA